MAEQNPDKAMWPSDIAARAMARSITAEMHSGFVELRTDCTMNLRRHYLDFEPSKDVLKDCERIEHIWEMSRTKYGADGPWLFGEYSIADVFYAPVATRFATYGLPRDAAAESYIQTTLSDPSFRRWRAMGLAQNYIQPGYDQDLTEGEWIGPKPAAATAVTSGPSENEHCPYSGDPVTDFLELDGRVFGFCNTFCRDKTLVDPEAWPDFMTLVG